MRTRKMKLLINRKAEIPEQIKWQRAVIREEWLEMHEKTKIRIRRTCK